MKEIILVGDIGSTKSSWWVSGDVPKGINLHGFNPIVHSPDIGASMITLLAEQLIDIKPDQIWYYGAGILGENEIGQVKNLLLQEFPDSNLHVNSDLTGAVKAACGLNSGTVVILGTGSHVAVFDGKMIIRQANALGYILGDEGGGSDIGKSLIQAYFYQQMPDEVCAEMMKLLPEGRPAFLKKLYSAEAPNQYLASFAEVASKLKDNEWIKELFAARFAVLMRNHLMPLQPIEPLHFVGSIGCIFADLIKIELANHALKAGAFLKDPSYRLFTMHLNHETEK
ncbi:MAG: hypothetical protein ABIQ02_11960 [Saprospiraceae bacterium]